MAVNEARAGAGAVVQQQLGLRVADGASFASFHAGPNAGALRQLRDWSDGGDAGGQLFLVGPPGGGKTHLAQAVCRARWDRGARAAYLPLSALPSLAAGLEGLPLSALIAVDELDALDPQAELALMRLIDASRSAGGSLLFAARRWPQDLDLATPDLRSRLQWGAVLELRMLGDADLAALLALRCRQRGVELNERATAFLLSRVRRDPGSLLAVLDAAYERAVAEQRQLTVPLLREILSR